MHQLARIAAIVLLLGVACTASAGPLQPDQAGQSATGQSATASGSSAPGPGSRVAIQYEASAKFPEVAATLKQHKVLEELQQFLSPLRLPKELKIVARDCGAQTVPYESGGPVTICYDAINQIGNEAEKIYPQDEFSRNLVITGATIEVVLHETAHAVFDLLQVPVWGREEDAADRLAA